MNQVGFHGALYLGLPQVPTPASARLVIAMTSRGPARAPIRSFHGHAQFYAEIEGWQEVSTKIEGDVRKELECQTLSSHGKDYHAFRHLYSIFRG